MKAFAVFENVIWRKPLERKVFGFCRRRQPKLLRFVPAHIAADVLYFFRLIPRQRYLEKRWSFLKYLQEPEKMLAAFFKKQKPFLPDPEIEVVSDQPMQVLAAFCEPRGLSLHANAYDVQSCRFENFRTEAALIEGEAAYTAYGTLRSPLMAGAAHKYYVYQNWITDDRRKYLKEIAFRAVLTYVALLIYAVALGYISLHYATFGSQDGAALYQSYMDSTEIQLLNIAPVVFTMFLLYFLFNNAAVAALLTSALTIVLTWISSFKMMFRGDPFVFEDVLLVKEATAMTGDFKIVLSKSMYLVILCALIATAAFALFLRYRPYKPRVRFSFVVALIAVAMVAYPKIYLSDKVYEDTYRQLSFQSYYNDSDQFQNRGFLYPFLRSTSKGLDRAPEGYNARQAKKALEQYEYEDIPEDKKVNVIAFMFEAYADFTRFDELSFTEDPYAYFHALQKESYSGSTISYAFVGGTKVPERMFLTGLTELPNFRKAINSYPWYFRQQGYTVEGSHPYYSWFYNRLNINQELGFQNYYFDEDTYMELNGGEHRSPDSIVFPHVLELFNEATARGEHYFSFNVTYQGHGPYSGEADYDHPFIENLGYSEATFNYLNNYLNTIDDIDDALKDMVEALRESDEPVVLIFFGDHMPWMGNNNSAYIEAGINIDLATDEGFYQHYSTPYVIWANDAAKEVLDNDFVGEGPDISTNFLMNLFFEQAGYKGSPYAQYTTDLMKTFLCIHSTGIYITPTGLLQELTPEQQEITITPTGLLRELTPEQQEIIDEFNDVQYYWRRNFCNRE